MQMLFVPIYAMNAELSTLLGKMQAMVNGFIILLPNMVLALIVFAIFFFAGRAIKRVVRNLTRDRRQARNLGMVLGRLAQGVTILVGLFIALSIVIPSLQAGDLVQLLGVSSVAIGFARSPQHREAIPHGCSRFGGPAFRRRVRPPSAPT